MKLKEKNQQANTMKKQFLKTLTYITFVVFTVSCTQNTSDLETEKSTQIEQENEYMSVESDDSPVSSGCKDKFEYKNGDLVYVGCCQCDYWEEKLDEYLNRNNDKISDDQQFQNLTNDISLKPYVKKIYGFSTLEEAKQAYVDAGGNGTGLYRFSKPLKDLDLSSH